ncbi:MAG: glycosyl hydrolase-related protein [Tannerellaceae bacterium]|nr:glycosyl hydrolase-related protein [Tannerellaceae bacterium]MCD8263595.1 glycosyl hydrolase-related protein [Tannerellaceae bacterium]
MHAVRKTTTTGNQLPEQLSFLTTSESLVNVTTVKRADNSNDVIIRLSEIAGKNRQLKLDFAAPVQQIIKTNLIEDEEGTVPGQGTSVTLPVGHHAIETFKLNFRQ